MEKPSDSWGRVAVIGAGIQGCTVALELARHGIPVDLFDRGTPISKAGRWNEAKLHLGFVYARDPSMATARSMIRGAYHFLPFLRRVLGEKVDTIGKSSPFHYVVHRESLLGAEEIHRYLTRCDELCQEEAERWGSDLRETFPSTGTREIPLAPHYATETVASVFETPEISIHPSQLAQLIREGLESSSLIRVREHTALESLTRRDQGGFDLRFDSSDSPIPYRDVVNCTWSERLKFDRQLGIEPPYPWTHRFKLGCHIQGALPISTPSFTIVLGAFGDFVNFGQGNLYYSWYPVGRLLSSTDLVPPEDEQVMAGADLQTIQEESLRQLIGIAPGLRNLELGNARIETRGGYIVAWGQGEVNQYHTQLHERATIGVTSEANYHSVNTGKLTTATLFAEETAQRILADR